MFLFIPTPYGEFITAEIRVVTLSGSAAE